MTPHAFRVLVTRPAPEAQRWAQALQAHGIKAESLPLIEIAPLTDVSPLQAVWQDMRRYAAVMFVSANAVQHFMAQQPAGFALQAQAWGTGPGTQAALLAAGWPADRIRCPQADAPRFDSEALWSLVHSEVLTWAGHEVLIVRGADTAGQLAGRDWLAQQIRAAGGAVDFVVAYTRGAPVWNAPQQALAREAASDGSLWLLSSSQALEHLRAALPGQDWRQARALATHPRIAQAARNAGFGEVRECRPALADVAASIESQP